MKNLYTVDIGLFPKFVGEIVPLICPKHGILTDDDTAKLLKNKYKVILVNPDSGIINYKLQMTGRRLSWFILKYS